MNDNETPPPTNTPPDSLNTYAGESLSLRRRGVVAAERTADSLVRIEQMLRDIWTSKRKRNSGSGGVRQ